MSARGYLPLEDYGVIADGRTAALVARDGSVDWWCVPRLDSGACFARILDAGRGGHCAVAPEDGHEATRAYEEDSLVLVTTFATASGAARVTDALLLGGDAPALLRVFEGAEGSAALRVAVVPRFDYGELRPWLREDGARRFAALGGDDALVIAGDLDLAIDHDAHELTGGVELAAGERARLWLAWARPEEIDPRSPEPPDAGELDARLEATRREWREWAHRDRPDLGPAARRSALTLKALAQRRTGAIAAAATTSLPEALGAERNWDYRFSWIRDSSFAARSLAEVGYDAEADAFRRFVERSSAGSAEDLQILYGLGGARRLPEQELSLDGYAGSRPVRVGNGAASQLQLDAYGELVAVSWRWHRRGHSPDDDHWRFLVSLVEFAATHWDEPDRGLWEWRGDPLHFVHSKVMCWTALELGIRLAEECGREAPVDRWAEVREEIRSAVEERGCDHERGIWVQAFGRPELDAALLLLPENGFVAWDDPRMVRTVDALRGQLEPRPGLLYRYRRDDGLGGEEGAFLACGFWLAECLARQGRLRDAEEVFRGAGATANDLGIYSEEWSPEHDRALGNMPQGLTHLAHLAATMALRDAGIAVSRLASRPAARPAATPAP